MSDLVFRGNLNAANWPFLSNKQGRTILVGSLDTNASKFAQFGGRDADRDVGIPQALYLENVMPTAEGFQSVGFIEKVAAYFSPARAFDRAFVIKDSADKKTVLAPCSGLCAIYDTMAAAWSFKNSFPSGDLGFNTSITTAYVQERMFVCFQGAGLWEYDFTTELFTKQTLVGITDADVTGIVATNGYLIAFGGVNQLYWSSLTNPLDFTESLVTGAGRGNVLDLRGAMLAVLPISGGFILYSTENAVFAAFTGNIAIPFNFREVSGSGGVVYAEHVTYETNLSYHYAWTSKGLLKIEKNIASPVFPEVTDFVTNKIMEEFDYVSNTLTQTRTGAQLAVKLTHVSGRYLVISYGRASYTHALVFDEALQRWGKLKITHADCFSWPVPNLFGEVTYQDLLDLGTTYEDLMFTSYSDLFTVQYTSAKAREDMAFLTADGQIVTIDFDAGVDTHEGVLMLGKFQVVRNSDFTLHALELESVAADFTSFDVRILTSYDGKTINSLVTEPLEVLVADNLRVFESRVTGVNHTILVKGSFSLCTIMLSGINAGQK